jgi:predicted protein tyrosine phosphatase
VVICTGDFLLYNTDLQTTEKSMQFIQNVSMSDVQRGFHINPGENSMLISIVDPDMQHPIPKYSFKEIHRFKFLDLEDDVHYKDAPTQDDADKIVSLLQHAMENKMQVIVHCVAGICRSGAVVEVGVMMGFSDTETYRCPNLLLKKQMLKSLGWTYE